MVSGSQERTFVTHILNTQVRAKAHVRTTGYRTMRKVIFKGFYTLQEAEAFMRGNCGHRYKLDIKSAKEQTTPKSDAVAYYAVANGRSPGVYLDYS
jgi:viroplasmin and RNaseH domain-containing protein